MEIAEFFVIKTILYLSRLRIPRLECVDFSGGLGAKAQDESAISSLCNKVNCAEGELRSKRECPGVQRPSVKDACYKRGILERGRYIILDNNTHKEVVVRCAHG